MVYGDDCRGAGSHFVTTITSSSTLGIQLTAAYASPVVIQPGVTITNPFYPYAVASAPGSATSFLVQNAGTISSSTGTYGVGLYLAPGGTVSNLAGGRIAGSGGGVLVAGGAGTLSNAGSISGADTLAGFGVSLAAGGVVNNLTGGAITVGANAVRIAGTGTVTNQGTIGGAPVSVIIARGLVTNGTAGAINGVFIVDGGLGGGTLLNQGSIGGQVALDTGSVDNAGTIRTTYGITFGAAGTVSNAGLIAGNASLTAAAAIHMFGGGSIGNTGTITGATAVSVAGAGVVDNAGRIAGSAGWGVILRAGGTVTNHTSATITGGNGVLISGGAGTLLNDGMVASSVLLAGAGLVTNSATGTIESAGAYGVRIGGLGTVTNAGVLGGGTGVILISGGLVTNAAGGTLVGGVAIDIAGGTGTVQNAGYLSGNYSYSIRLAAGGTVTNTAGGLIVGGVSIGGTGLLTNAGSIGGLGLVPGIGVVLAGGGTITNAASAAITGSLGVRLGGGGMVVNGAGALISATGDGVDLLDGGTLANAGTIIGNNGTAVSLGGTGSNRLVLTPGFAFSGAVLGNASASNTLELAAGAGTGTLTGLGTQFIRFGAIVFDPGADWMIAGAPRGLAGPISGFDLGDTIELTGITVTGSSYAGGVLTLEQAGAPITLNLGGFSLGSFQVVNGAAGADISLVACFRAGTRIRTPLGEVPVEMLQAGDRVVSAFGGTAPVVWAGHRRIDCRRHPRPADVMPVRVRAGAFGPGQPGRDLWLSPDHAVHVDGVLIPIRYLVNGRSIATHRVAEVAYHHIELAAHDVVFADGLPCESYLDTGNRAAFANAGPHAPVMLHPDFARAAWHAQGCAELVLDGPLLAAARQRLLARAVASGHAITRDGGLRVLADGMALPADIDGSRWRVRLPGTARQMRLVSRSWIPAHMHPAERDTRELGIAVANLLADGKAVPPAAFTAGWHAQEPGWRWTTGDGQLQLDGARRLEFEVILTGTYWEDAGPRIGETGLRPPARRPA